MFTPIIEAQAKEQENQKPRSLKSMGSEEQTPELRPQVHKPERITDLDLEDELLTQYIRAKQLLQDVEFDSETPLNQKAQMLNSITGILQAIIKSQQDLFGVERVKLIETTLIKVLQEHETLKDAFLTAYEQALKAQK